jgi:hypothetical protein
VKVNGTDNKQTFTTVAAADAVFNNSGNGSAIDFGALSGMSLQLDISLSITESSVAGAGGGYDFGMLIGDPPPTGDAAAYHNMVTAMASFGAGGGDASGASRPDHDDDHRPKFAGYSA